MTANETNGAIFHATPACLYSNVVIALSALVMQAERELKNEQTFPGFDPDRVGDKIKHYADRVKKLRDMRETFESLMNAPEPRGV